VRQVLEELQTDILRAAHSNDPHDTFTAMLEDLSGAGTHAEPDAG